MSTAQHPLGSTWFRVNTLWRSKRLESFTVTKSTSQTVWYLEKDWNGKDGTKVCQARKGSDWFPERKAALAEMRRRLEREEQTARDRYSLAAQALKDFNREFSGELGQTDAAGERDK